MTEHSPTNNFSLDSLTKAIEPSNLQKSPVNTFSRKSTEDPNATTAPKASPFGTGFNQEPSAKTFQFNPMPTGKSAGSFNFGSFNGNNAAHQPVPSLVVVPSNQRATQPSMPISQKSSSSDQAEQDEKEVALTLEQNSLVEKKIHTKLRDTAGYVFDRDDPTSPLFSSKTFEELKIQPELLKGIYRMGFQKPSRIQEVLLPLLLANPAQNVIAQSQSGTGKTGAFSLTILSRIDPRVKGPQAMIIAPTFELAIQIGSVVEQMASFLPYIKVAYAVRQNDTVRQPNLKRGEIIEEPLIIGTPGTIEDWCFKKRVVDLSKLTIFCVDEADVMIDVGGFQESCSNIVSKLNFSQCLIMLFSATYSDPVMEFARKIVPNPRVFRLKREKQTLNNIRQFFIKCYSSEEKYAVIQQVYACLTVGQAMIFCRTKATARELNVRMARENHSVRELTGALDIEQRASIIKAFREGVFRVLISTNVTSRGIDVDDVSLVINYDMPVDTHYNADCETYLHRIGRCGRFGRMGYTFNLVGSEKDLQVVQDIENHFQHQMEEITIDDIITLATDEE